MNFHNYFLQTHQNRVQTSVRAGRARMVPAIAGLVRREKARRTVNQPVFGRCSTRSSCTRCGRATRPTRDQTP